MPNFSLSMRVVAVSLVVILLAAAIYWPGLSGPFVLDDQLNIGESYIADPDVAAVIYTVTHNASGWLGRSVSVLSFVITGLFYDLDPWGYRFHNLLIHFACGLALFRFLLVVMRKLDAGDNSDRSLYTAGITTTLWLVHPLMVSTVLYSVQRMTQLAALFSLLALLAYVSARQTLAPDRKYLVRGWVLFPLFMLLAVLSKENGALIPLYVLILELVVFRIDIATLRRNRHIAVWLGVFVALPLVIGGLFALTHLDRLTDYSNRTFSLNERLLTQLHVVAFYARLILLPQIRSMSLFHDDFPVTSTIDAVTLLLMAILIGLVVLIWTLRRRAPVLAFGLAWFLVSHLLESTILPLELVFEHRNYLAAVGLLLPLVWLLHRFAERRVRMGLLAAFALVFMLQTYSRAQEWSSEGLMMTIAVHDHPDSSRARTLYGNYLYTQDRFEEAIAELNAAKRLKPTDPGPTLHLLMYACAAGRTDAELLLEAQTKLRTYPVTTYALNGLENLLSLYSRKICTGLTLDDLGTLVDAALSMPENVVSQNYGYLLRFRGMHAFLEQRYAQGVISYRLAHEASGRISILAELVRYQISFDQLQDAEDTFNEVVKLNAASYGTEDYVVATLSNTLDSAKNGLPPEPTTSVPQNAQ